jgi:hypothetical protein
MRPPPPLVPLASIIGTSLAIKVAAFGSLGTSILPARHLPSWTSVRMTAASSAITASRNLPSSPFILASPLTQVVSDIDDTLKSSGGVSIAGVSLGGIDVQYDRGDFYPGVFQFMWEISLLSVVVNQRYYDEYRFERFDGENSSSSSSSTNRNVKFGMLPPPKVAVLTARAEELKAALEIKDSSKLAQAFRKTGESSKTHPTQDWGIGPVMYGSVSEWIIQNRKGLRKFNNFERLLEQDPSGQIMQVCLFS